MSNGTNKILEPTSPAGQTKETLVRYGEPGIYIHKYELEALEAIEKKCGIKLIVGKIKGLDHKDLVGMDYDRKKDNSVDVGVIDNHVVYLKIVNKELKEIPAETNDLTELKVLAYFGNELPKMENMSELTNLEEFHGQYNQLGKIGGIENWTKIKKIDVRGNPIESIPMDFPESLKEINLWETKIDTSDPRNKDAYKNLIDNGVKVYIEERKAEKLSEEPDNSAALIVPKNGRIQAPEGPDIEWYE